MSASTSQGRSPSTELPDPSIEFLLDLEAHARSIASNVDMALRDLRGEWRGWDRGIVSSLPSHYYQIHFR